MTMGWICWDPHASTLTGKPKPGLAVTPSIARVLGIGRTRPVQPARPGSAGRPPSLTASMRS
jgi:hypothetical protein